MASTVQTLLKDNTYPGRGIILGINKKGHAIIAYFIMGRSENSRNRIFTRQDDGIITQAADPQKLQDPSLIIYAPVRTFNASTIVTNGNQTDTIYQFLNKGQTFADALRTRTFEPDPPIYTPRISGLLTRNIASGSFSYKLSILKASPSNEHTAQRFFYEYDTPERELGHLIHTYKNGQEPIQSFNGEPCCVEIPENLEKFSSTLWDSLNEENKVSLFVRSIAPSGEIETIIYNKYSK